MLKLQNINCLYNTFMSTQCWKCLSGSTKFRYYASSGDNDFKKMILPMGTRKKKKIMAQMKYIEFRKDSVNEVIEMGKETKNHTSSHIHSVEGNRFTKVGKIHKSDGATMNKAQNLRTKYNFHAKNEEDEDDIENYRRDKYGRYALEPNEEEDKNTRRHNLRTNYRFRSENEDNDDNIENYRRDKYGRYVLESNDKEKKNTKSQYLKTKYSFHSKNEDNYDDTENNRHDKYGSYMYESNERKKNSKSQGRFMKKGENRFKSFQTENYALKPDETFDKGKNIKSDENFLKKEENLKSEAISNQVTKNQGKMVDNRSKGLKKKKTVSSKESLDGDDYIYYTAFMELFSKNNIQEPPCIYVEGSPAKPTHKADLVKKIEKEVYKINISRKTFSSLGVNKNLVGLLADNNILGPTHVQAESIPKLLKGSSAIIESATGSGKTLTFILPIIQNLASHPISSIIIVPTRELVSQIYKQFVSYGMENMVSRYVSGVDESTSEKLCHTLKKKSKILIGTPKILLEIVESNPGYFRQVRTVVVDEVDKLLSLKFRRKNTNIDKVKPTEKLLQMFMFYRKGIQFIATSATISDRLVRDLQDMGFGKDPALVRLTPEGYKHGKVPENIQHQFIVIPDPDTFSKIRIIGRLFEKSKENSILVFIHHNESVDNVVDEFEEMGYVTKALYKELLLPTPDAYQEFQKQFEDGDVQVVVSTEATVRGIDFPFLSSIYLTFVPDTPEKYLHLAGRTGRLGQPAKVVTVIGESNPKEKDHLKRRLFLLGAKSTRLALLSEKEDTLSNNF